MSFRLRNFFKQYFLLIFRLLRIAVEQVITKERKIVVMKSELLLPLEICVYNDAVGKQKEGGP